VVGRINGKANKYFTMNNLLYIYYYFSVITFIFLSINLSFAQNVDKKEQRKAKKELRLSETTKYFNIGFVFSKSNVLDERMSSLVQSGSGIGLYAGGKTYRKNKVREYSMQAGYERLLSPYDMLSHQIWTQFNYTHLYQLPKRNDYIFAVGPVANIVSNTRVTKDLSNNIVNWELLGSIGIAAYYEQAIRRSGRFSAWVFFADAQVPFLYYVSRPNYAISSPVWRDNVKITGGANRVNAQVGLIIPVRKNNPNLYRISYQWTFLHNKDNEFQKVVNGRHALVFIFLINAI